MAWRPTYYKCLMMQCYGSICHLYNHISTDVVIHFLMVCDILLNRNYFIDNNALFYKQMPHFGRWRHNEKFQCTMLYSSIWGINNKNVCLNRVMLYFSILLYRYRSRKLRLTTVGDPPRWPCDTPLSTKVDTKFRRQVATEFFFFL
jgi:hypothetical protein